MLLSHYFKTEIEVHWIFFPLEVTLLVQRNNLITTVNECVNCSSLCLSLASVIVWLDYYQMDTKCRFLFYTDIKIGSGKHKR